MADLPWYVGPELAWGRQTCAYDPTMGALGDDVTCGQPGAWHVFWTEDGHASVCCQEHRSVPIINHRAIQVHKLLPDCTMPGAVWYKEEGVCRWEPPLTDEPPILYAAKELELASS